MKWKSYLPGLVAAALGCVYLWRKNYMNTLYLFLAAELAYATITQRVTLVEVVLVFFAMYTLATLTNTAVEGFKGQHSKRKSKAKKGGKRAEHFEDDPEEGAPSEEPHMDLGTTWLKAYQKLSPEHVKGMREDTKELLATQKELMGVMKGMAPVVKEGVQLVESFKKYFNSDGDKAPFAPMPK